MRCRWRVGQHRHLARTIPRWFVDRHSDTREELLALDSAAPDQLRLDTADVGRVDVNGPGETCAPKSTQIAPLPARPPGSCSPPTRSATPALARGCAASSMSTAPGLLWPRLKELGGQGQVAVKNVAQAIKHYGSTRQAQLIAHWGCGGAAHTRATAWCQPLISLRRSLAAKLVPTRASATNAGRSRPVRNRDLPASRSDRRYQVLWIRSGVHACSPNARRRWGDSSSSSIWL